MTTEAEKVTIYVTKYSATDGKILRFEGADIRASGLAIVRGVMFHPGEWFTDEALAFADARARKTRKIASLKKSLAKVEASEIKVCDAR